MLDAMSVETAPPLAPEATPGGRRKVDPTVVGERLREARKEAGLSLRGLAKRVGVSASLMSQIERGRVMPSVGTLYGIVTELGLSMDDVFRTNGTTAPPAEPAAEAPPPASDSPVLTPENRPVIELDSKVRWERLTARPDPDVEFLDVTYAVGGASCEEDALMRHPGREYTYVMSGTLGVQVGFDKYELHPGDSIAFESTTPHRLWTIGDEPVRAICVVIGRGATDHQPLRVAPDGSDH
jgi:transcriptional regulator with XRE-family HTH domain